MVSEEPPIEEKEDLISAEPGIKNDKNDVKNLLEASTVGQVTSLRKLGGSKTESKDQVRE